ncbi:MAG: outer membrane beta-barrel protein [Hoeflea sp.]|uniref:outer membrane beta-barrel protein n=1 Tax=Hoeflea sp. TaxID=1940281 RepID=UPI001D866ED6|nr:outer membrane beta-barrel protein [Hoeflea sp.]MBU4528232.1 outer membrane beta-barrel protein [Alphaproteobacteria bacterium]MBU4543828.1 outer membrane beta-barrel protein [Alphaproteobacteria bacterium]MBU4548469.1 outer membrane beta-barrel protein [Alphaproteobacteria bacterium]MBV1722548.1 outer membrane beta-barrel protein [Hoeflea sp.]MBV1762217.1 outer membrane beta-barrel protein [Hoeflea sp.]
MRKRDTTALTDRAAHRAGLRACTSMACLLALMSGAQAQSASGPDAAATETYGLRGTTTGSASTRSTAASTLYGALPASRENSATSSRTGAANSAGQSQFSADPVETDTQIQTGTIGANSDLTQADRDFAASLARQNDRVGTVDDLSINSGADDTAVPGFMLGSLTLRPTLAQRVVHESINYGASKTSRIYSETTLSGTLQSDWSRHQLSVEGSATYQKNLSGTGTESPSANLDVRLNLDLLNDMTGIVGAGYSYSQESRTDPNAIAGATTQSGIHELRASIGLQKDLGVLRGTTSLEVTRRIYGNATSATGGSILVDDRDTLGAELTARIGYVVSPALIPFLEASVGREKYDQRIDNTGAERSSTTYGARGGAEFNFGEKLSGELGAGYVLRSIDDSKLSNLSGLTLDGEINWSPRRGTDVMAGLSTTLESATTAGESGSVVYEFDTSLTQQIHSAVVARLGASAGLRDYDARSGRRNQQSYGVSTGLTWNINRYLDLEADASYTRTKEPGVTDEETTRVGLGLRLRR